MYVFLFHPIYNEDIYERYLPRNDSLTCVDVYVDFLVPISSLCEFNDSVSIYRSVRDIQLSKSLSWLLRHGAIREGLQISQEGYIQLPEILNHKSIKGKFNVSDIERVVKNNDKQRFKLRLNPQSNTLEIKANQGHTVQINNTDLKPILKPKHSTIVHGTYLHCWPQIKVQGLSRMKRQHIHLAKGTPNDKAVISGMRHNAQVHVYIALDKAIADGLKFYESENGVILTAGNENGYLEPKYFSKVLNVCSGEQLYP